MRICGDQRFKRLARVLSGRIVGGGNVKEVKLGLCWQRRLSGVLSHHPILAIPSTQSKCLSFERMRALCCFA
jgi:hypothetical protein